jgi:hypothetical protein
MAALLYYYYQENIEYNYEMCAKLTQKDFERIDNILVNMLSVERPRKSTKNLIQDSRISGQDSNRAPAKSVLQVTGLLARSIIAKIFKNNFSQRTCVIQR